jgi:hypothetical protein
VLLELLLLKVVVVIWLAMKLEGIPGGVALAARVEGVFPKSPVPDRQQLAIFQQ